MDIHKIYSNYDIHAAYTALYAKIQTALLNIHSYNKSFYSSSLQNTINYFNSIPVFIWIWCALSFALFIAMKIFFKLQKTYFPEFLSPKSSKKNPYHLNIFDLAKTSYRPEHTEAAIDLIEKLHYDVNTILPSNGLTIFLCACLGGTKPLIQYMLLKGANIHSVTRDGDSALYLATYAVLNARQPDITILDLLIAHGCIVNQQNNKGYTALHRAASKGNLRVIKCLLRHGSEVTTSAYLKMIRRRIESARSDFGTFIKLFDSKTKKIVRRIEKIKKGANLNLPNKSGIYPIDSATNAGHPAMAEFLAFNISNPHVWDVVDPHTPPKIKMGLQSPFRPRCMQSPHYLRHIKRENGHRSSAH